MATTAQQEDGSKWIFQRVLKDDVNYFNLTPSKEFVSKEVQELIILNWINLKHPKKQKWHESMNVIFDKNYTELQKIFYPNFNSSNNKGDPVPKDWLLSYFSQQQAMLEKFSKSNFKQMNFDREGGFMKFISDLVKPLGVSKKDTWDPADIWIVDTKKETNLLKVLKDKMTFGNHEDSNNRNLQIIKLQELNALLRELYRNETVIGVSLKKSGKRATYVDVNVGVDESTVQKEFEDIEQLTCKITKIQCDLSVKTFTEVYGGDAKAKIEKMKNELKKVKVDPTYYPTNPLTFGTQETTIEILDEEHNKTYVLYIKGTTTSHYSNLKYEPKEKGKGSAKLGKAPVEMVDVLLKSYKIDFVNSNRNYPSKSTDVKGVTDIINKLKTAANKSKATFISNENNPVNFQKNVIEVFKSDPVTAQSKLMQLDFLVGLLSLEKSQLDKLVTDIVYVAMKKGKKFGPFGKVY